jgi:hypothetical protein
MNTCASISANAFSDVFVYVNDCDGCLFATTAVVGVVIGM